MSVAERIHSGHVCAALEKRYNPESKPPQYATFREVSDAAQKRRIDFVAVNTWQSRGRNVEGVEIKVARADWLKELAHPKADSWYAVVNRWWIAAPPGIVQEGELPETWGLLELRPHGDKHRLFKVVDAPKLTPPADWPLWFVMRLLARGIEIRTATPEEVSKARSDGYHEGYERGQKEGARQRDIERTASTQLRELLNALGINYYSGETRRIEQIKQALALIETGNLDTQARQMAARYRQAADAIDDSLGVKQIGLAV